MNPASRAFWAVKEREPAVRAALAQRRRDAIVASVRTRAFWRRNALDLDIHPSVRFGRDVRIDLLTLPDEPLRLHIGPRTRIGDRVHFLLHPGADIEIGADNDIRHDVVLNTWGELRIGDGCHLSWNTIVHVSQRVVLADAVGVAERVTIADSTHRFSTPGRSVYHTTVPGEVTIGLATWVCPNACITRNVHIGEHCIVGSGSTVTRDVPDAHLASGVPAVNSPITLPWDEALAQARSRAHE